CLAESDHGLELRCVAHRSPFAVVSVLLASSGVASSRLQVPPRIGADPNVGPCRRDDQAVNAPKGGFVVDRGAVVIEVTKAIAASPAADARLPVTHIAQ